jgi:hypothetical protein
VAKGSYSSAAKRTKAGYTAVLRALWGAHAGAGAAHVPSRVGGASPPLRHDGRVAPALRPLVHDYLSGRSPRLVAALGPLIAAADLPEYLRAALVRDLVTAREFFELGPSRVRELRLRHRLPTGPVSGDTMAALVAADLQASLGRLSRVGSAR